MKAPKGETAWVLIRDNRGKPAYLITSKETSREYYFIYKVSGDKLAKLGRGRIPRELEEKYAVSGLRGT